jgi:hypothetical protein
MSHAIWRGRLPAYNNARRELGAEAVHVSKGFVVFVVVVGVATLAAGTLVRKPFKDWQRFAANDDLTCYYRADGVKMAQNFDVKSLSREPTLLVWAGCQNFPSFFEARYSINCARSEYSVDGAFKGNVFQRKLTPLRNQLGAPARPTDLPYLLAQHLCHQASA